MNTYNDTFDRLAATVRPKEPPKPKLNWEEPKPGTPIYVVWMQNEGFRDHPLLRIQWSSLKNQSDPWTIDIMGIRKVTRDERLWDVDKVKIMAESMLHSLARDIYELSSR